MSIYVRMLISCNVCVDIFLCVTALQDLLVASQKEDLHSVRVVQQAVVMVTQTNKLCTNLVGFGNLRGSPVRSLQHPITYVSMHTPLMLPLMPCVFIYYVCVVVRSSHMPKPT